MTGPVEKTVLRPGIFSDRPEVIAAVSTRRGGVSAAPFDMNLSFRVGDDEQNVRRNRELFFGPLGITPGELAIPFQVHSRNVVHALAPGGYSDCDGLVTRTPRVFLCVTVADCVPVLLYDPMSRTVAAVHAGWRGTAEGIVTAAVSLLQSDFSARPADILAYLGPSAGKCCYRLGEEVARLFDPVFIDRSGDQPTLDLRAANIAQLDAAGVRQIEVNPSCTISEEALFHSFRRDRERSGRMMAVIGLDGTSL
jgi:YfiH family protein